MRSTLASATGLGAFAASFGTSAPWDRSPRGTVQSNRAGGRTAFRSYWLLVYAATHTAGPEARARPFGGGYVHPPPLAGAAVLPRSQGPVLHSAVLHSL